MIFCLVTTTLLQLQPSSYGRLEKLPIYPPLLYREQDAKTERMNS